VVPDLIDIDAADPCCALEEDLPQQRPGKIVEMLLVAGEAARLAVRSDARVSEPVPRPRPLRLVEGRRSTHRQTFVKGDV